MLLRSMQMLHHIRLLPQTCDTCHPEKFNTTINGEDAYDTFDLLAAHPTKPGYWKIVGRADDQIMHNTGEKVCYCSTL